jgi:hypothetical protein
VNVHLQPQLGVKKHLSYKRSVITISVVTCCLDSLFDRFQVSFGDRKFSFSIHFSFQLFEPLMAIPRPIASDGAVRPKSSQHQYLSILCVIGTTFSDFARSSATVTASNSVTITSSPLFDDQHSHSDHSNIVSLQDNRILWQNLLMTFMFLPSLNHRILQRQCQDIAELVV